MPKREVKIEASLLTPGDVIKVQGRERTVIGLQSALSPSREGDVYQVVQVQAVTSRGSGHLSVYVYHFTETVTLVIGDE